MGFRNPIKSASALDTRGGAVAGVSITGARAVFWDGSGSSGSIFASSSGGGGVAGSSFQMVGDGVSGTSPALVLYPDGPGPTGGYQGVAKILGDRVQVAASSVDVASTPVTLNSLYKGNGPSGGDPAVDQIADRVEMRGGVTNVSAPFTANAGTLYPLGNIPPALAPAVRRWFPVALLTGAGYSTALVSVDNVGGLNYVPLATTTVGFLLNLGGIRWRLRAT